MRGEGKYNLYADMTLAQLRILTYFATPTSTPASAEHTLDHARRLHTR